MTPDSGIDDRHQWMDGVVADEETIHAVRRVIADWDGRNWIIVWLTLRSVFPADQIRGLDLHGVRMAFAAFQRRIQHELKLDPDGQLRTHDASFVQLNPSCGGRGESGLVPISNSPVKVDLSEASVPRIPDRVVANLYRAAKARECLEVLLDATGPLRARQVADLMRKTSPETVTQEHIPRLKRAGVQVRNDGDGYVVCGFADDPKKTAR